MGTEELMKTEHPKYDIPYRQEGDYLMPDLEINDRTDRPIGNYGRMRQKYLEEHKRGLFSALLLSGKLMEHLADIEEEAQMKIELFVQQMDKTDPPPDKAEDSMAWARHMNMTQALAESTVIREVVYG